jgi:hypothetical protein
MGTEFKLHRPASGLKKSPESSGLCKKHIIRKLAAAIKFQL